MEGKPHTVIVIGAGASAPYGFPLGKDLPRVIRESCGGSLMEVLHQAAGGDLKTASRFRDKLARAAQELRYRRFSTVDQWLDGAAPESASAIKAAIAFVLLKAERDFLRADPDSFTGPDWYQLLFEYMRDASEQDVQGTRILTFNYERSLELDLIRSARGEEYRCGRSVWGRLPLWPYHLHGCIGRPPDDTLLDALSARELTIGEIDESCASIRTYSEDQGLRWEEPRSWIRQAKRLIFLGFGFHEANLRNLGVHPECPEARWHTTRQVWATAFPFPVQEQSRVDDAFRLPIQWIQADCKAALEHIGNPFCSDIRSLPGSSPQVHALSE